MVTKTLRNVLASGAAVLMLGVAGQATADLPYNEADFYVVESLSEGFGRYTIHNQSSEWYVYAFAVTNPTAGQGGYPYTDQEAWLAYADFCGSGCGFGEPSYNYYNGDLFQDADILTNSIAPDSSSSRFFFSTNVLASAYRIDITNGSDFFSVFGEAQQAGVPEPATWALMIGGFGLAGASLRRRRAGTQTNLA